MIKNKKGMLGNIISGLMVMVIGITLIPTIAQQVSLAMECNLTINSSIEQPIGATDSFGGGGSGHFGGYDGEVEKSWDYKDMSLLKNNNESVFGNVCVNGEVSVMSKILLNSIPSIFAILILGIAILNIVNTIKNVGMV